MTFDLFSGASKLTIGRAQTESVGRLHDDALLLIDEFLQLLSRNTPVSQINQPIRNRVLSKEPIRLMLTSCRCLMTDSGILARTCC
jgi:hypothetical protein